MVKITELLVRKKAEHNEGEIFSLEEISLHQEDIERIENLDRWCKHLKILYLQSNLIPKIENVGRLKQMEYLNLALNNIERIENLEGCESLQKLDLTVNFVGELTSLDCLKDHYHFRELYLTGNPCAQYEGYRDYVIATLPQLQDGIFIESQKGRSHLKIMVDSILLVYLIYEKFLDTQTLDGIAVERSERIKAVQDYGVIRARIVQQQIAYKKQREKEKEEARIEDEIEEKKKKDEEQKKKPGFDGSWYTDINDEDKEKRKKKEMEELDEEYKKDKEFFDEKSSFTPESRVKTHQKLEEIKNRDKKKEEMKNPPKPPRRMFSEDGRPLNVNESKLGFSLTEDDSANTYVLDFHCYKYLDTSMIDVDVQPNYIRIKTKGKTFQLALDQDVNADASSCKRSQISGHLLVTMPKAKQIVQPPSKPSVKQTESVSNKENIETSANKYRTNVEKLEVDASARKTVDIGNIVTEKSNKVVPPLGSKPIRQREERPNSEHFVDNPDVPPLE